ncbi:cytochrome bc1 complex Rieske iron-sulfur subunit [Kytococcus aerolatus]|nr:Rieske 2Fe-2S domain-containing protein [Kytococcus aerolatus]
MSHGSHPARFDDAPHGEVEIPEYFENPGHPPHVLRWSDVDPAAARRAERQVAFLFLLSILGTLGFIVAYFWMDQEATGVIPGIGTQKLYHFTLGLTMAVSLLGIGFGVVHWAKTLMDDEEVTEERHVLEADGETRRAFADTVAEGLESSQIMRRPLIKWTLGGALGLFALPLGIQLVGSMGPLPRNDLAVTMWKKGTRLVTDPDGLPVKAADVTLGSVFHIMPEGVMEAEYPLNEKAKASVLVMRLNPSDIKSEKQREWGYEGIVAYSKVCTHVGCPVALYEQQTHHLLCPCHQSTFDVTDDCKVIFGPAKRPLPQLKIAVDDEGYLTALGDFSEPVGPSYWEREL